MLEVDEGNFPARSWYAKVGYMLQDRNEKKPSSPQLSGFALRSKNMIQYRKRLSALPYDGAQVQQVLSNFLQVPQISILNAQ